MAEQEKIKLTELLEACLDFKKEPTPKNELAIKTIVNRFVIKEYLPMNEKFVQIALILNTVTSDELDPLEAETWLSIGKIVYGILAYVDNLENDLNRLSLSGAIVDLLYEMGVIDGVLSHCEKDYLRMEKMLEETINFTNIFRIVETTSMLDSASIDNFVKEIHSFKNDLTPETLEKLKSIVNASDPAFQSLKEILVDQALSKAMDSKFEKLEQKQPEQEPEKEPEPVEEKTKEA